jgi:MFS transporter, putative metabolite:H+ symporter
MSHAAVQGVERATTRVESVDDAVEAIGLGRFQWRLLGINGLVWAGDAMEIIAIGFILPSIIATFGTSAAQAGLVGSLFFAGMLFGAWGFGALADRVGRRRVFLITIALNAVFALLSAVAPSFELLLLSRFLTGLAVGGTLPVDYAIMAEYLPKRDRGRFLVYLESFWALGTVLIALISWAIVPQLPETGWRWILAINALPGLIGFWVRLGGGCGAWPRSTGWGSSWARCVQLRPRRAATPPPPSLRPACSRARCSWASSGWGCRSVTTASLPG